MKAVVGGLKPKGRAKLRWLERVSADMKGVDSQVIDVQQKVENYDQGA